MTAVTLNSRDYDYDEIFAYTDTNEERLTNLYDKSIIKYRTKTIKSGNVLESEIYPVWNTRSAVSRAKRCRESRAAQKALNKKNALKNLIRLVNTNFTDKDIWGTFTYEDKKLPKSAEDAQKEMAKYVRRLKYYGEKHGYENLKYVYVTEYEDDPEKGKKRVHHHIVCNFPDRDVAEKLWQNGARRQVRRLQADEDGYEGLIRYILKDPKGTKRYITSKNLEKPQIFVADYKFTRKKVRGIVVGDISATNVFEKMYKGYSLHKLSTYTSDYVSGAYIYAKMTKQTTSNRRRQ